MVDFKDGSCGCRYTAKRIAKRVDRYDQLRDHQYDGIEVFAEETEGTEQAMRAAITSALEKTHLTLCHKSDIDGKLYEADADAYTLRELPALLRWDYEEEEESDYSSSYDNSGSDYSQEYDPTYDTSGTTYEDTTSYSGETSYETEEAV